MRRTWPSYVAVLVVGAGAGLAIAGGPGQADTYQIEGADQLLGGVTIETTPVSLPPIESTDSTEPSTTADEPATTEAVTAEPSTATSVAPASTAVAASETTLAPDAVPAPADVRVVIANGDGRAGLAGSNADRLAGLGYPVTISSDVDAVTTTQIFYRPDFAAAALQLRADLGTPAAIIGEYGLFTVTDRDDSGDLIVVLGPDAIR
jgi:hypothetical protein